MSDWPEVIELKGYTPKPGDVLFITFKQRIHANAIERFAEMLKSAIPGVKFVLLEEGATVQVPE